MTASGTFRTRIRRVRMKDGSAPLYILPREDEGKGVVELAVETVLSEAHMVPPIVGCAIVVWTAAGHSMCAMKRTDESRIPSILVPDYVRNRLLIGIAHAWVMDDLEEKR